MLPDDIVGTSVGFQKKKMELPRTEMGLFMSSFVFTNLDFSNLYFFLFCTLPYLLHNPASNESPVKIGIELVIMQILGFEDFFELCHRFYQDHHDLDNNLLNLCC